jgi:hypothetical protein
MSGEVSYDVYVKKEVDSMGRDEFGEAVAHFVERSNAVALKRRLVARGETVHVERSVVHGLSEEEKERRFADYSRVPEYNPPSDYGPTQEPSDNSQDASLDVPNPGRRDDAEETPEDPTETWWRRLLGAQDRRCV